MALEEAHRHKKDAKKALATSYMSFKFSPDHFGAQSEYFQAAQKYNGAGYYREAVECYKLCQEQR